MSVKDFLKHRLNPVTIGKEVGSALANLAIQGRDEFTNVLFNGSAYWPGQSVGQSQIEPMPEKLSESPEALLSDGMGGFYNSLAPAKELVLDPAVGEPNSYLASYQPQAYSPPEITPGQSNAPSASVPVDKGQSDSLQAYLNGYANHPTNRVEGMDR